MRTSCQLFLNEPATLVVMMVVVASFCVASCSPIVLKKIGGGDADIDDVLADSEDAEDPSALWIDLQTKMKEENDSESNEVIVLDPLNEEQLKDGKVPYHIAQILGFMLDLVEKEVLGARGGDGPSNEMCSAVCGRGDVMNVPLCLGCVGLVNSHLKPIPISKET